jgi:glycosyltransferase involved in cell wall biosynthesis
MVCLATNFGIRGFTFFDSVYFSIRNYFVVKPKEIKRYFAKYIKQKNKLWIEEYPLSNSVKGYVFSVNTLWYSDEYNRLNETTNKIRADFMDICLSMPEINFEGGFVPSQLGNENFKHLHLKKELSQTEYIHKLRKSIFAFNTPAVWNCHGWKLGEYLCMGKAIISTPLSNDLPFPLIHGESIHIINNQQELIEAIRLLNENEGYRMKLEKNARDYYEKYVSPEASIQLLCIV